MRLHLNKAACVEIGLVLILTVFAAYLRMGNEGIVEFKRDEANLSLLALDFAAGGDLPLLGISSSVGFPNAPVNVYVLTIPYLFSSNPLHATQFVGLLNVLAILLSYAFVRRYVSMWPAFVAMMLFAASPWAVIFSRKIWAQNMLPLFVAATVFSGVIGYTDGKRWARYVHWPMLSITGQIHYGAFVIIPVSIFLLWVGKKYVATWSTIVGFLVAFVVTVPYLMGLSRAGLLSPIRLAESISYSQEARLVSESNSFLTIEPVEQTITLISGQNIHSLAGGAFLDFLQKTPDFERIFPTLTLVFLITAAVAIRSIFKKGNNSQLYAAIMIWIFSTVGFYIVTWTEFFIHYLIPLLPAAFVLMALSFGDAYQHLIKMGHKQIVLIVSGVGGFIIVLAQSAMMLSLLHFANDNYTPGGFGTPLGRLLEVQNELIDQNARNIIGRVGGDRIGIDDEPTIWAALLYDQTVRFERQHTQIYSEEAPLILDKQCNPQDETLPVFALRPGEGCYTIYQRTQDELVDVERIDPARFDNEATFIGYNWESENACLTILWEIRGKNHGVYSFSVHGFDSNGDRNIIADRPSWPTEYWHPSDRVLTAFCMESRADVSYFLVGMYELLPGNVFKDATYVSSDGTVQRQLRLEISHSH